jgi:delta 1-pyrroline-5-carboxylate dehydrogenase
MDTTSELFFPSTVWNDAIFDGKWRKTKSQLAVVSPATGEHLGHVGGASVSDVGPAAAAARNAQSNWVALPYQERGRILARRLKGSEKTLRNCRTGSCVRPVRSEQRQNSNSNNP